MLKSMSVGIICDFAPVMLLVVFHYKNFNKKVGMAGLEEAKQERSDSQATSEIVNLTLADKESAKPYSAPDGASCHQEQKQIGE